MDIENALKSAYIDVRGVWPILVIGKITFTLEGCERSITVKEALDIFLKSYEKNL